MLARPLTDAETRVRFESVLSEVLAGAKSIPEGVGLDDVTSAALWDLVGDPADDLLVQRARDELEAQLSGAHARAAAAAVRPSGRRS